MAKKNDSLSVKKSLMYLTLVFFFFPSDEKYESLLLKTVVLIVTWKLPRVKKQTEKYVGTIIVVETTKKNSVCLNGVCPILR